MSRRGERKISTDGGAPLGANPFDGLDAGGLPAGRPAPAPVRKKQAARNGRVEVRREKAGRGGKTVTTLSAFATHLPPLRLEALAQELKQACACGGTVKGRAVELQGDVRDRVMPELEKRGFQPVRAGG